MASDRSFRWGMPGALLSPRVVVIYGTLMCGSGRAQTLGMMVARTKAVKVSSGAPIGYAAAFGRALFEWLLAAFFFLPWVFDVLFLCGTPRNRRCMTKCLGQSSSG
jgi:uncharacterized RDD family membrane protein YckC